MGTNTAIAFAVLGLSIVPGLTVAKIPTISAGSQLVESSSQVPIRNASGDIIDFSSVAYVANGTILLNATATNETDSDRGGVTWTMVGARIHGPDGSYWSLAFSPVTTPSKTVPAHSGVIMGQITITGLPNFVTLGDLELNYHLWTNSSTYQKKARIYILDSTPVDSMTEPWTEVLEDSCLWADGYTGESNCITPMTRGCYSHSKFDYPGYPYGTKHVFTDTNGHNYFYLSDPDYSMLGNCVDVSCYLKIAIASIGYSVDAYRISAANGHDFMTNNLLAIGHVGESYGPYGWTYHQVIIYGGGVYDATAAMQTDLSGNAFNLPVAGWLTSNYWQTRPYGLVNYYVGDSSNETVTMASPQLYSLSGGVQ